MRLLDRRKETKTISLMRLAFHCTYSHQRRRTLSVSGWMKRNGERRKGRSEGRRILLYSLSVVLAVLCLLRAVTPPAIRSAATVVHAEARAGTCEALATSLDPTLRSLVTKPFFRYFKVALDCNCTLFGDSERGADSGMCGLSHCAIGLCSSSELPPGIKHWSGDVDTTGVSDSCCDWDDSDCEWTHDDESASGPGIAVRGHALSLLPSPLDH